MALDQIHIGLYTLAPLAHSAPGASHTEPDPETGDKKLVVDVTKITIHTPWKGDQRTTDVPTLWTNAVRGLMRQYGARHLLETLDLWDPAAHRLPQDTIFTLCKGGIRIRGAKVDIASPKAEAEIRERVPLLSLFGAMAAQFTLQGLLKFGALYPICQETTHDVEFAGKKIRLASWIPDDAGDHEDTPADALTCRIPLTRAAVDGLYEQQTKEPKGNRARATTKAAPAANASADAAAPNGNGASPAQKIKNKYAPQPYTMEAIIPYTWLVGTIYADSLKPLERSALALVLHRFGETQFFGLRSAAGAGRCMVCIHPEDAAAVLDNGDLYEAHLREHKTELVDYLRGPFSALCRPKPKKKSKSAGQAAAAAAPSDPATPEEDDQ